eukprot:scaffold22647_cov145-Cylindrotheca_fusiformis.AAC.10
MACVCKVDRTSCLHSGSMIEHVTATASAKVCQHLKLGCHWSSLLQRGRFRVAERRYLGYVAKEKKEAEDREMSTRFSRDETGL